MKKILYILLLALASCSEESTTHEVRYSPDGTDSVAYVRYFDGQQFNNFFMPHENFKIIFDSAGYAGVYEYWRDYTLPLPEFWRKRYSTYKVKDTLQIRP